MKTSCLILLVLFCNAIANPPHAVTFYNTEGLSKIFSNDLKRIEDKLSSNLGSNFVTKYEYVDKGMIYNNYITLKNFKATNLTSSSILSPTLGSEFISASLSNGQNFTLVISFDFQARTGLVSYVNGNGQAIVVSQDILFYKRDLPLNSDAVVLAEGSHNITFIRNFSVSLNTKDSTALSLFNALSNNALTNLTSDISNAFQLISSQYYRENYNVTSPKTTMSLGFNFFSKKYDIELSYYPAYYPEGVYHIHNGTILEGNRTVYVPKPNVIQWENFNAQQGQFQLFFNIEIIQAILKDLVNSKDSIFKSSISKNLAQRRKLQEISSSISHPVLSSNIHLSVSVKNITLTQNDSALRASVVFFSEVATGETVILSYDQEFDLELIPSFYVNIFRINFSGLMHRSSQKYIDLYNLYNSDLMDNWLLNLFNREIQSASLFDKDYVFPPTFKDMVVLPKQGVLFVGDVNFP